MPSIRGAVLAGGAASRVHGEPKGLYEVGGRRILDRVVDALTQATGSTPILVANAPDAPKWHGELEVVRDLVPGLGALGGIYTAVKVAAPVVCVAWDMPFVTGDLLAELGALVTGSGAGVPAARSRYAGADVAIPESDSRRGLEPLCAAYGPACAAAIEAAVAAGDRRAIGFHASVRVARLGRDEVARFGDPAVLFFNVNTPEDLARAEAMCPAHGYSR